MKASDIITEVASQLNDDNNVTWPIALLLGYITTAEEAIVTIRPDTFSTISTMKLAVGTKQNIPAGSLRLLDIKRNMGTDGATPGRVVNTVESASVDLFAYGHHSDAGATEITDYSYDERTPDYFYCDPPSDGTGWIEVSISRSPPVVTTEGQTLSLKDIYRNAIIQWCMFRAYSIEVDSVSSQRRAAKHEESFYGLMGKKFKRDAQYSGSAEVQQNDG